MYGQLMHRGEACRAPSALGKEAAGLIAEVGFDYNPESGGEKVESTLTVSAPNVHKGPCQVFSRFAGEDRVGYAVSRAMSRQVCAAA